MIDVVQTLTACNPNDSRYSKKIENVVRDLEQYGAEEALAWSKRAPSDADQVLLYIILSILAHLFHTSAGSSHFNFFAKAWNRLRYALR